MAITCERCSKPAVVRAQVKSRMLGLLSDQPLCADHERSERATVAMQGGLTSVTFEPLPVAPAGTDDTIGAAVLAADSLDCREALLAVLHHLNTNAQKITRDGDPMVVAADVRDVIADKLGVEREE